MLKSTFPTSVEKRRRALICGAGGQDGAYLSHLLLQKGYEVIGTSRDAASVNRHGLQMLDIANQVDLVSMSPNDFRSVLQTIVNSRPDEIYNLAGQTSVGLSFDQPVEAIESIAIGTLNILEAIRFVALPIRFYNAGSGECFGDTGSHRASETSPFSPRSPYAVAKVCAHNLVANYRAAYSIYACTGILFNHESPLRPERFVTQKVVSTAARIANGASEILKLGNLDIHRDWGSADEYVEAMWLMLQQEHPADFVIATGTTVSLEYFVDKAFSFFDLDWRQFTQQEATLLRPSDVKCGSADPSLAHSAMGWRACRQVDDVIENMCTAAIVTLKKKGTKG